MPFILACQRIAVKLWIEPVLIDKSWFFNDHGFGFPETKPGCLACGSPEQFC
jgi:hypothetical protein